MACCAALAIVFAAVRTAWGWLLGRAPAVDAFPPGAQWGTTARPEPTLSLAAGTQPGVQIGRPLAATVIVYGLLLHVLASSGLADVQAVAGVGWLPRDAGLAVVAVGVLALGRRFMSPASALVGVGALWFSLGVVDMHLLGGFEFQAAPVALDAAFHLSGWWLMVAAGAVAALQRRQDTVLLGTVG